MPSNNDVNDASIDNDAELYALEQFLASADGKEQKEVPALLSTPSRAAPRLREDSTFAEAFSFDLDDLSSGTEKKTAPEYNYELDSSDDEEVKNFLERKYNEYGSDINKKLKDQRRSKHEEEVRRDVVVLENIANENRVQEIVSDSTVLHIKNAHNPIKRRSLVSTSFKRAPPVGARNTTDTIKVSGETGEIGHDIAAKPSKTPFVGSTIFTDPVFGLRIINPLISSALLIERMSERKAIPFSGIAFHTQRGDLSKDWVIAGVLVNKLPAKMTKKGDPYSIWRLSDLKGDIKMISLFLFKSAHKELWKTSTGTCLAILNSTVFEKRIESGDVACLSIDTAQKVMILGQSKDFGVCRAKKKNGDPCNAIINIGDCDYCIFHMKQEYGKMSRRSELQSVNAGRGLNELRNKVLGKSEVFYGGKSFSAVPAKKSAKQIAKDSDRMMSLSEYSVSPNVGSINHMATQKRVTVPYAERDGPISKLAANVELSTRNRLKDLERLRILQAESNNKATEINSENIREELLLSSKATLADVIYESSTHKLDSVISTTTAPINSNATSAAMNAPCVPDKFKDKHFSFASPKLSQENFTIEINVGDRKAQLAKLKAIQLLKAKPIEKTNPNSVRGTNEGKRRAIDELNERFDSASKRQKSDLEQREMERKSRIQRIMDATSSHANLIDMREQQEQDKYFSNLEKKEALEEKMLSTFKVPCKAVICKQCKYTAFSASEHCKKEQHHLKVIDAEKRFFQCKDCGNRTATVFKLPKTSCSNCKSSRWQRTAMIRERKVCDGTEGLSVRGDEETFIGSLAGKASLNLLVPEE